MRDTNDMMEDHSICEDTMMECSSDGGGLDDLVNLASNIADSAPSIRDAAERLLTLLGVDDDSEDVSSSEDEGVEVDLEDSDTDEPIDTRLLNELAVSLAQELKYAKQNNNKNNNNNKLYNKHSKNETVGVFFKPEKRGEENEEETREEYKQQQQQQQQQKKRDKNDLEDGKESSSIERLVSSSFVPQVMELCGTELLTPDRIDDDSSIIISGESTSRRSVQTPRIRRNNDQYIESHQQSQLLDYPARYQRCKRQSTTIDNFSILNNPHLSTPLAKSSRTVVNDRTMSSSQQQLLNIHNNNKNNKNNNNKKNENNYSQARNDTSINLATKNFPYQTNDTNIDNDNIEKTIFGKRYESSIPISMIFDKLDRDNDSQLEYDDNSTEMLPAYPQSSSSSLSLSSLSSSSYSLLDDDKLSRYFNETPRLATAISDNVSWSIGWDACATEALRYLIEDEGLSPNHPTVITMKNHLDLQRARIVSQQQFPTA